MARYTYGGSDCVRWGVIGLGWFGEIHADTLAGMPGSEVAALCTRRAERLTEWAARYGARGRYTDYKDLLADPSVDAVSITTHVNDHRDIAIDALRAGKHVLLEKPMAATVEDCERIVAAARGSDARFMVGHICRFDPRVALAKQAIDEGRLGRIISMHARRNLSKAIGEANLDKISALLGDGIHDADLMLWFTGAAPQSVYAQEVHPGRCKYADGAWAMIRFDSGAVGVVESIWHLAQQHALRDRRARMEIIGTEGALYIDLAGGPEIHGLKGLVDTRHDGMKIKLGSARGGNARECQGTADRIVEGKQPDRSRPRRRATWSA